MKTDQTRTASWLAAITAAAVASGCATPGHAPDPVHMTAAEAAQAVCSGQIRSEDLVRAYPARAKARPELNAFVTLDEAGAIQAARAVDARRARGEGCRALEGVPLVVKDNIEVAGLPTTGGTPVLKAFVPRQDAPVVKALRDAGAVLIGKTNMHELAFGISGYNPAYNTGPQPGVRNAYDTGRMSGGSSAGNGAALGARLALAGLGTDTGGSVRIPCALNGCAALRPTVGRYPAGGIVPVSHTRDTAGPMALTVADLELLDRVVTDDAVVAPAGLAGVRLGLVADLQRNLDPETQRAFDETLKRLTAAGAQLVPVEMNGLMQTNAAVGFPVALYEAYDDMVAYLGSRPTGVTIQQLVSGIASPDVKGTYEALVLPRKLPGPQGLVDAAPVYEQAMRVHRPALIRLYRDTFASHRLDALVFPTTPRTALAAGPATSSVENFSLFIQNTDPGSNAGLPGLQIPAALGHETGMPVGVELDGLPGSDRRLLAIGMAIEKVLGRLPLPRGS